MRLKQRASWRKPVCFLLAAAMVLSGIVNPFGFGGGAKAQAEDGTYYTYETTPNLSDKYFNISESDSSGNVITDGEKFHGYCVDPANTTLNKSDVFVEDTSAGHTDALKQTISSGYSYSGSVTRGTNYYKSGSVTQTESDDYDVEAAITVAIKYAESMAEKYSDDEKRVNGIYAALKKFIYYIVSDGAALNRTLDNDTLHMLSFEYVFTAEGLTDLVNRENESVSDFNRSYYSLMDFAYVGTAIPKTSASIGGGASLKRAAVSDRYARAYFLVL